MSRKLEFTQLLFVGLIFCAIAIALYDAYIIVRALQRSVGVVAMSEAFNAPLQQYQSTLLVVGDSTAVGTGANKPSQSIAGRVGKDFPNTRIDNLGVNGALISAVAGQLARAPLARYDAVLIQVGGNDALRFTTMNAVGEDIEAALTEASKLSCNIAMMSTGRLGNAPAIPWPIDGIFSGRARRVRDLFSAAATRHGAHYVNLFVSPGSKNPFQQAPNQYYARDGLHPSGDGYGAWYEMLREQVLIEDWLSVSAPSGNHSDRFAR